MQLAWEVTPGSTGRGRGSEEGKGRWLMEMYLEQVSTAGTWDSVLRVEHTAQSFPTRGRGSWSICPPPRRSVGEGCASSGFALHHFLPSSGRVPAASWGWGLGAVESTCPGVTWGYGWALSFWGGQ